MSDIRVRFAPSPTGPLHLGGVRTALYNYLFAKRNKGTFILRIEDTDQRRYVEGAEQYILDAMKWCGFSPDESPDVGGDFGPYRQSERKHLYKQYAEDLVEKGWAYFAFDSQDEIEKVRERAKEVGQHSWQYDGSTRMAMTNSLSLSSEKCEKLKATQPFVIRFKVPEGKEIVFEDHIRGKVVYRSDVLDDKVLFKSDGQATYHLANIVDDHLMKISHVIRGEEWLPSAPLHVLLYDAFGWNRPQFAHLPLILKPNGNGKLSKRDGDKDGFPIFPLAWKDPSTGDKIIGYRESGYLPEAFVNMLLMLGWNPGTEQELFSLPEMIELFSLERVVKSGAKFSPEKAKWFNEQHLRSKSPEELATLLESETDVKRDYLVKVCSLMKERASYLGDILSAQYLFKAPTEYDAKMVRKKWKEHTPEIMKELATLFDSTNPFDAKNLESALGNYMEKKGYGFGQVGPGLRLLLTGSGGGPAIPNLLEVLGKEESLSRMINGIKVLTNG